MSLAMMLLLMAVFGVVSAGLLYASKVPAIQSEWSALTGQSFEAMDQRSGRTRQVLFIVFTFTSPILLASLLSLVDSLLRRRARRRPVVRRVLD